MQRARQENDKEIRRQQILEAAKDLLEIHRTTLPSVNDIAKQAKLAKGSVYNYFPTKEEIYFTLVVDGFDRWVKSVKTAYIEQAIDIAAAIDVYVDFCVKEHEFMHLASIAPTILEHNISLEMATNFKRKLAHDVLGLAEILSTLFPTLTIHQTLELYLASYATTIGIWQVSNPSEIIRAATEHTETRFLRPDFESTLRSALLNLWRGTIVRGG